MPPAGQSDSVVDYESANLDWVESELVIPRSGHSVQSNPLAIEEVRRILVDHADRVCRMYGVVCAPSADAGGAAPVSAAGTLVRQRRRPVVSDPCRAGIHGCGRRSRVPRRRPAQPR